MEPKIGRATFKNRQKPRFWPKTGILTILRKLTKMRKTRKSAKVTKMTKSEKSAKTVILTKTADFELLKKGWFFTQKIEQK